MNKLIKVEVAYARADKQVLLTLELESGSSIEQAIQSSGILTMFPHIDLTRHKVGIFSKLHQLTDIVNDGDRVEIYRPLVIDPKEARRSKAKKDAKKPRP